MIKRHYDLKNETRRVYRTKKQEQKINYNEKAAVTT